MPLFAVVFSIIVHVRISLRDPPHADYILGAHNTKGVACETKMCGCQQE